MARRTTPPPAELPRDSAEIDLIEGMRERMSWPPMSQILMQKWQNLRLHACTTCAVLQDGPVF